MAKRKASNNNWRAQQLAAYKSLAVMAGNVGNGAAISPTIPTYTAKPSSPTKGERAKQSVLDFWGNKNNTGIGAGTAAGAGSGGDNQNKRSTIAKVLDALSVGGYAVSGGLNSVIDKAEADSADGRITLGEMAGVPGAVFKGVGKGAASAFNDEKKITNKDIIDKVVKLGNKEKGWGVDTNDKGYKLASAAGGLVGDIFLDPTTYLPGVAVTKLLKGGKAAKIANEFFGESQGLTKIADKAGKSTKSTAKASPNVKAQKSVNYSKDLVPTGVGKTEKFSGPGIPAEGFEVPDANAFKLNYNAVNATNPSSISANTAKSAGAIGRAGNEINPQIIESSVEDTMPRMFKDAVDNVGTTIDDAVKSTASETAAKSAKDVADVTDEITNLARVQHNAKFTNPALKTGEKFSTWAEHAKNGDYSPEQLQPFFDYHKVDNVDDLIDTMKGKNYKAKRP